MKFTGDLHDVQPYYQDDSTTVNTPEGHDEDSIKPDEDYYPDHELEHHDSDTFYTDRRYNQNRTQRNDYRQNDYRRENQNDYRRWNQNQCPIQNQNRKCFVCGKQYCWSTRYPPKGSKNKPKDVHLTQREQNDIDLATELRAAGKITTPGKPFEQSTKEEIDALIARSVFRFELYNLHEHGRTRIFKSRIVNEVKGKTTDYLYEKSRLVVQGFNDDGKRHDRVWMLVAEDPHPLA